MVRSRELEAIGLRMDGVPLQDALWTDRAEVASDDFERCLVLAGNLGVVDRGASESRFALRRLATLSQLILDLQVQFLPDRVEA